ncbi:c-type cytochrome biogenesis protein CcmI [Commensalibacter oyaizuii]|uniref:C-type cytochrome biogenesis protein CcmI n=1 Tax=Commensalibacter oyaizuii TaxID=3043873 RepID=A0ABT6PY88_9PROT|nr:c-type cytochrome biogenesis protein CcmI [Commensalibacter sp. TBRC 16381]MDI2089826.1 c-type cytochrome biogenesis protein CcmI [Commensalibacter sp. TBRC 16381]
MLWIVIIIFSLLCLLPCWVTLCKSPKTANAKQSALRVYQSQLNELNNDYNHGFILQGEYDQAKLEIQRRLLKADQRTPSISNLTDFSIGSFILTSMGILCIPMAAIGLYLVNGVPSLPAQPLQPRLAEQHSMEQQILPYLKQLREKLPTLALDDPKRIEGYILLGKIEASRGEIKAAITAWKEALQQRFNPNLAVQIAEMQCRLENTVSKDSADLFKQALSQAPKDAPWRELAEQRITQYEKLNSR